MTPHQQGQAAFLAGGDRFANPHPMASASFASWRNGWNSAQSAVVFDRLSVKPGRAIHHDNMNYGGR